jgi:beta-mannosidase
LRIAESRVFSQFLDDKITMNEPLLPIPLHTGWQFKQRDIEQSLAGDFEQLEGWLPGRVPGVVHQDLLAAGIIPNPHFGKNELDVQWVGEADWLYRCTFEAPAGMLENSLADLCFEGLDTFATVWLNGEQILLSDNMFLPQRVRVEQLLLPGENTLQILFESALRLGKNRQAFHGEMKCWNTDPSRMYVRKAGYHYGWDWGPVLLTAGPWRGISLEVYSARIGEIQVEAQVDEDLKTASISVRVDIENPAEGLSVRFALADPQGSETAPSTTALEGKTALYTFHIAEPQLWWPNGYGAQPLYQTRASLLSGESVLHERSLRLGLRRLHLLQEPIAGEKGRSFTFEINGIPIFCGGANWIPADNFLPGISQERYRGWVELARTGNMQMLRVWGGGAYEEDVFYDLCDEAGILIWQDFMFGCGMYPAYSEFLTSVRAEAEAQVKRLRHHACLALWCGNNEDYMLAKSLGQYDPQFKGDFSSSTFPAREIYERLLPEVCAALDPGTPYWPGSPYNGEEGEPDEEVGDKHIWSVWHEPLLPYQAYPQHRSRFISEFGMQSYPRRALIDQFASEEDLWPQSAVVEFHNKGGQGPLRIARYIHENLRFPCELDDYIYATQFIQAEALRYAYENWRRNWGSQAARATSGALVWQFNDCWPAISWAVADYEIKPKPAWYAMRRALLPVSAGLLREGRGVQAWAVSSHPEEFQAAVKTEVWTLEGEHLESRQFNTVLEPNAVTELGPLPLPPEGAVLAIQVLRGQEILARSALWPEPFKYYSQSKPEIRIEAAGEAELRLHTNRPVKGLWLEGPPEAALSDNLLDLLPGDPQVVKAVAGPANPEAYRPRLMVYQI